MATHGMKKKRPPTAHQLKIFLLSACGFADKEIAEQLNKAQRTVENTLKAVCVKLDARNTKHAIHIAWQQGIFKREEEKDEE